MSNYAVVNPATGETIKEYPTITDDELRAAIGRADGAYKTWSGSSTVAERAALVRKVGELHNERRQELAEIIVREMGKPIEQALSEVDFAGEIYDFYADNAEDLMADEPIKLLGGEGTAVVRRSPFGVLLGIMPWNFPYYQVARFAGPNLIIGNPILLKHAPQCPESAAAIAADLRRRRLPRGRLREHLRDQRADRVGDRRPARARRLGHRLRARRRRGRRDRRPQPEEGRARAGRLGPVHRARHRRPRRGRRAGRRSAPRQHRPVLQRGEALHRHRRATTTSSSPSSSEQIDGGEAGRPDRRGHRGRPALLEDRGRPARGPGQAGDRRAAPRSSSAASATATSSNRRSSPGSSRATRPPRKSSSARSRRSTRSAPRRRRSSLANDTPFGLGSYLMTNDKEQAERVAERDRSRAWSTSTWSAPTAPSCRSAASSAPASAASSAASAPTSSSTRS